jgi:hypothetical protein
MRHFWGNIFHFMYCFFFHFDLLTRCINTIIIPYMATLSTFLVVKKVSRRKQHLPGKQTFAEKHRKFTIGHLSFMLHFTIFFCAYGSLPNAQNWWCLQLGVGGILTSSWNRPLCEPFLTLGVCNPNCSTMLLTP